jgi:hypothetical protein
LPAIVGFAKFQKKSLRSNWIKRYKNSYATVGIGVLFNVKGQGRKPIFDKQKETALIEQVVRTERQKLENAKVILEKELNKTFNIKTLKIFLRGRLVKHWLAIQTHKA